jgi:hypothetical protein
MGRWARAGRRAAYHPCFLHGCSELLKNLGIASQVEGFYSLLRSHAVTGDEPVQLARLTDRLPLNVRILCVERRPGRPDPSRSGAPETPFC